MAHSFQSPSPQHGLFLPPCPVWPLSVCLSVSVGISLSHWSSTFLGVTLREAQVGEPSHRLPQAACGQSRRGSDVLAQPATLTWGSSALTRPAGWRRWCKQCVRPSDTWVVWLLAGLTARTRAAHTRVLSLQRPLKCLQRAMGHVCIWSTARGTSPVQHPHREKEGHSGGAADGRVFPREYPSPPTRGSRQWYE